MRAVVQRVQQASVTVAGEVVSQIEQGLLVFLGVGADDNESDSIYLADKIAHLRVFADEDGKMNLNVQEIDGSVLAVSQFTLYGDCRKGRRPSFSSAARPEEADELYQKFVQALEAKGVKVATGIFQTHMDVALINDGPVTILLSSEGDF